MKSIAIKYESLVKQYQQIETETKADQIHDKRVILRRIFPILSAYDMNAGKVKNGEKAFKLFGKLRDIQVQIMKLESVEQSSEITIYLSHLKERELKIRGKVGKFCIKKKLKFPSLSKTKINKAKLNKKADKFLINLVEKVRKQNIDDAQDTHKIRIEFKKFRYMVEMLACIQPINETELEKMKVYQDLLGEIQDYEVLIQGITIYFKKRKLNEEVDINAFEQEQNSLIEKFDNELETFIAVCSNTLYANDKADK